MSMKIARGQSAIERPGIAAVLEQHVDDARILWSIRSVLTRAPHVDLIRLRRFDERLAAHLDGLQVARGDGARLASGALQDPGPGSMFVATVLALKDDDTSRLDRLSAVAEAAPDAARGMTSAFGWVADGELPHIVKRLYDSGDRF